MTPRFAALLLLAASAHAASFPTPEQALAEALPGARLERVTEALDEAEMKRVEELAGSRPDSRILVGWRAFQGDAPQGTAWLDSHVVRTQPETVLVLLAPDGSLRRVEILAFREPREYLAPARWLQQFEGRSLEPDLELKRGLRGITGATLTSRAVTAAARRVLAVSRVLGERATAPVLAAAPVAAHP